MFEYRVMIATPTYTGDVCIDLLWSLMQAQVLCLARGIELDLEFIRNLSMVDSARDYLLARFLEKTEATHIMFIDADLGFQPDAIHRMVARKADVIGGVYPYKGDMEGQPYVAKAGPVIDGLRLVERLPGGFLLLSRNAVEKLCEGAPSYKMMWDHKEFIVKRVFEFIVNDGEMVSEDYRVCDKLAALGFPIMAECDINFSHAGRHVWKGNLLVSIESQHTPDCWRALREA